ncbi:DUF6497 family protein [Thalassococcus sp. BH17M4-6]
MTGPVTTGKVAGAPRDPATPAEGAWKRGRGCLLVLALTAAPALAEIGVSLPSGLDVTLHEVLTDDAENGSLFRFRFVAPEIAQAQRSVEELTDDMQHLCQEFALPKLSDLGAEPRQIVVSLSAEITDFGVPTPDVRQVFEAFSVRDDVCIWEPF